MAKHFPENAPKRGNKTTVMVLGLEEDMNVKAKLHTGCYPNNYMKKEFFDQHAETLSQYLIKSSPERVNLATSGSAHYITQHIMLNLRHVDSTLHPQIRHPQGSLIRYDYLSLHYLIPFHGSDPRPSYITARVDRAQDSCSCHVVRRFTGLLMYHHPNEPLVMSVQSTCLI
jgi:hypothetical protein